MTGRFWILNKMIVKRYYKFWLALIVLTVFASAQVGIGKRNAVSSEPESRMFDAVQLLRDVQVLSADDMEGRSANRPAMQKARDHVEKRFRESGLQPTKQEFEIRQRGSTEVLKGVNFVGEIKGRKDPTK